VHGQDRADHPARRQGRCAAEDQHIREIHDQQRDREQPAQRGPVARQARPQAAERPGHPFREETRVGRRREPAGTVGCDDDQQQAERDDRDEAYRTDEPFGAGVRAQAREHASEAALRLSSGLWRIGIVVASLDMRSAATIAASKAEGPPKRAPVKRVYALRLDGLDVDGLGALSPCSGS